MIHSIRHELQIWFTLGMLVFSLLFILLGGYAVRQLGESYLLTRLEHDAEALLGALKRDDQQQLGIEPTRLASIYQQPFSGHYFTIHGVQGVEIVSRSLWDIRLDRITLQPGEFSIRYIEGPAAQNLLVLSRGYHKLETHLTISVAEDITPLNRQIGRYQLGASLSLLLFAGSLLLLQWYLITRSFTRLDRTRRELEQVGRGEITHLNERVPVEVQPLVQEINRLLGLLLQRIVRSRHATGNLAHALKRPLNLLDQALDDMPDESVDHLKKLSSEIKLLSERELRRARLAGEGTSGQQFNIAAELPHLVQMFEQMYRDKPVDIRHNNPTAPDLPLDREDMIELLGNLLDNACKWCKGEVQLMLVYGDTLNLSIEDDGEGVPREKRDLLTQRGIRIDEGTHGHGLGLSIVTEIVDLYNGTIRFETSPLLGGLKVSVSLPITRSSTSSNPTL